MTFKSWTVLPHDPIEKLSSRLWTVSGKMLKGNQRRMVVVRRDDGSLVVHNAIALDDAEMAELDQWGEVRALLVPNAFHRMDVGIWKERYPKALVYCPSGASKSVSKVVSVDGDYSALANDKTLQIAHLEGMKGAEGILRVVDEGASLIANDALLNLEPKNFFMDLALGPVGKLSVPLFARVMWMKDRRAFVGQLQRLAGDGVQRVIVGHGATVETDARAQLEEALARLG